MRTKFITTITLIFISLSFANGQYFQPQPRPEYVGVESNTFNFVASSQRRQMWCWAASIEMVLKYHGVNVTQEDIAARTFGTDWAGNPPPFGATIDIITQNLNNWGVDRNGRRYRVRASVTPARIADSAFLSELDQRKPLIVAYGPNINSGHVVVLTAASFFRTQYGPTIHTLVVRDPYPNPVTIQNRGRIEYLNNAPPQQGGLPAPVQAVWFIDVVRD